MSAQRENLQTKLDAFRTLLIQRRIRHRHSDNGSESDHIDVAFEGLLAAIVDVTLHTNALVEALAAKKGIRR